VEYQMKRFFSPISSKFPQSSLSSQNAPRIQRKEYPFETIIRMNVMRLNEHISKEVLINLEFASFLKYSVTEDIAYCLCCYLFQDESIHQGGSETFSSIGFRSWHKKKRLDTGKSNNVHN
ncbi:hypothetical protein H5410_035633, partial [Solanum commersonii]